MGVLPVLGQQKAYKLLLFFPQPKSTFALLFKRTIREMRFAPPYGCYPIPF